AGAGAGRGSRLLAEGEDGRRASTPARLTGLPRSELGRIAGRGSTVEVVAATDDVVARALGEVGPVVTEVRPERGQGLLLLLALDLLLDLVAELPACSAGRGRGGVVEAGDRRRGGAEHLEDEIPGRGDDRALDRVERRLEDVVVERLLEGAGNDIGAQATLVLRGRVGRVLRRDLLPIRVGAVDAQRLVGQVDLVGVLVLDDPNRALRGLRELALVRLVVGLGVAVRDIADAVLDAVLDLVLEQLEFGPLQQVGVGEARLVARLHVLSLVLELRLDLLQRLLNL